MKKIESKHARPNSYIHFHASFLSKLLAYKKCETILAKVVIFTKKYN